MTLAATNVNLDPAPISSFYNPVKTVSTNTDIAGILSGLGVINILFFGIGVIFMGSLLAAAVGFINSQGAPEGISKANTRMINSLLGLVITFGAFLIVKLVLATVGGEDISIF